MQPCHTTNTDVWYSCSLTAPHSHLVLLLLATATAMFMLCASYLGMIVRGPHCLVVYVTALIDVTAVEAVQWAREKRSRSSEGRQAASQADFFVTAAPTHLGKLSAMELPGPTGTEPASAWTVNSLHNGIEGRLTRMYAGQDSAHGRDLPDVLRPAGGHAEHIQRLERCFDTWAYSSS